MESFLIAIAIVGGLLSICIVLFLLIKIVEFVANLIFKSNRD